MAFQIQGTVVVIVPLKKIEYRVYGDPIIVFPKPYSIYTRGTICELESKLLKRVLR